MTADVLVESALALSDEEVSILTSEQRINRVVNLLAYSRDLLDQAIDEHVTGACKDLASIALLYSGGNDSTVLAHIFRNRATHAIHANTGIGIEQTRVFVRETCQLWGIPLIEKKPRAGDTYRELVIEHGFPGPAHHFKMYQRLKERCLRQARSVLIRNKSTDRVIFLAGRRRNESKRRMDIPEVEREGNVIWVSPLALWTALDLATYRQVWEKTNSPVPVNEVSALIHMSGECLCGSFATRGELEEIGYWFPRVRAEIEELEAEVAQAAKAPAFRCRWGWGADKEVIKKLLSEGKTPDEVAALFTRSESGKLCTTCAVRDQERE